jgi:hypothetical protein
VLATNLPLTSGSSWVVAADVNGDGKVDLINTISAPYAISVFFNTSTFFTLPFTYTTNNGAITITGYTGTNIAVTIPSTINGLPVTSIAYGAFQASILTSVIIPGSITSIGDDAFYICTNLTSVTISNGVTSIGISSFANCSRLSGVAIPASVTSIGVNEFAGCTSLTNISVDASNPAYSSLNGVLFDKAQATLVQFPGGLGGSYTIPNGVTSIGYSAFVESRLTSVTIPGSVTSIGETAFQYSSLTSVTIPANVTSISGAVFQYSGLTSVTIANGVTSIGPEMFAYCANLTSVTIPGSVTNIGVDAFAYSSLTSVTIANGVTSIAEGMFFQCNLTSVTIPASVTSIGGSAFQYCALTSVTIPSSVTNIGSEAFYGCVRLTSAYFQGNAPPDYGDAFLYDPATVYYLFGTTGWGSTFGSRPTQVITPAPPALGISTYGSQPAVFFPTATGTNYVLQMTTNLTAPINWVTVSNGVPISGIIITNPPPAAFFRLH